MGRDIFLNILKYGLGSLVITLAAASVWPWYLKWDESKQAAQSLPSIVAAGQAIKLYEQDWGKLPSSRNWVQSTSKYNKITPDPTYTNLTKIDQPNNPGWAMNAKMGLTIGQNAEDSNAQSIQFPENAVLLAPSFDPVIFPQRDGLLPIQPLSSQNDTPTQHGLRLGSKKGQNGISGLYLLNNGNVRQLSLKNAEALLQIRPTPPSKKSEQALSILNINKGWEGRLETNGAGNEVTIKETSINMPLIPIDAKPIDIKLKIKSEKSAPFIITAKFYNKYKMPVNIETINGEPIVATELTTMYTEDDRIYTAGSIANQPNTILAFNPSYGSAYPTTIAKKESYYIKSKEIYTTSITKMKINLPAGTIVTPFKDWDKTWVESAQEGWKQFPIIINENEIPPEAAFLGIRIENKTYIPLTIKGDYLSN